MYYQKSRAVGYSARSEIHPYKSWELNLNEICILILSSFFYRKDKLIHVSNFLFSTFIHLNGHTIRLISLSILTLSLIQAPCTFYYECLLDKLIFRNFPLIFDLLKTTVFFSFFAVFFPIKIAFPNDQLKN